MISRRLGQAPARWPWRLSLTLVLGLALAGTTFILAKPHRYFVGEAEAQGWLLEGGSEDVGLFSSTIRGARLSWQSVSGGVAEIERMEIRHWPWFRPRVTVWDTRVHLRGDTVTLLRAIDEAALCKHAPTFVGRVDVTYDHRVLGTVELQGIVFRSTGSTRVLQAERVHVGTHDWRDVTLAFEPHQDMFVVVPGDRIADARVRLSCFPSSGGRSRWLLDVFHQAARPLASRVGWDLGSEFESSRVAGSLSLDIPDDAAAPVRGRMQFVLDDWPKAAPAGATHLLGSTLSLLSNLVPAADGPGWELPRVELTMPVFELAGKGHIALGEHPHFSLEAKGERTCHQLQALLPPSQERERVDQFLNRRQGHAAQAAHSDRVRLVVRWDHATGSALRPQWQFEPDCGLEAMFEH
jgi:hypothetical protein